MPASSPETASAMCSRDVMTARVVRRASDEAQRGLDLRAHAAAGELPGGGVLAHLGDGDPAQRPGGRLPEVDHHVGDVGGDDEGVGAELAGQDRGGEVLVDDGLDAAQGGPVPAVVRDRDATAAGADDDEAGAGQGVDRRGVDDGLRLGGGDDPAPALLAAVLPDLTVGDEPFRLLAREEAADRLRRLAEAGVLDVDQGAGDEAGGALGRAPARASAASSSSASVKPMVACVWATHQSSGTGGTTSAASSFLTSRLPTWGPLPWVSTTSTPEATTSAMCPDGLGDGVPLRTGRRGAVGPGHGVAAQGDDDARCTHPPNPSGRFLSGEVVAGVRHRSSAGGPSSGRCVRCAKATSCHVAVLPADPAERADRLEAQRPVQALAGVVGQRHRPRPAVR